jgi:hypothetical protein
MPKETRNYFPPKAIAPALKTHTTRQPTSNDIPVLNVIILNIIIKISIIPKINTVVLMEIKLSSPFFNMIIIVIKSKVTNKVKPNIPLLKLFISITCSGKLSELPSVVRL